jgi:diguanylate cyclase (GGDEF)-like protein
MSTRTEQLPAGVVDAALADVLDATRALLWIGTRVEVGAAARELVTRLGGRCVLAAAADAEALPIDLSFGAGEPVLPAAAPDSVARLLLERHLPIFVRDAHRALDLAEQTSRLAEDAAVDPLTRVANRRMLGRALGRLSTGSTVIMIDLDHFKSVNDTLGHAEGDRVLRALGHALAATVRASDRVGRYGGEEFVVILADGDAEAFLARLRATWTACRPCRVTFSAGIAAASPAPTRALRAADRAMYRAKEAGRDQWQRATEEDYE